MNSKLISFLSIIFILINVSFSQQTLNSTKNAHNIRFLEVEEDLSLTSNTESTFSDYPNIRIHVDYSLIEEGPHKEYIQTDLIPSVVDYLQGALKIKRPLKTPLRLPKAQKKICGAPTPNIYHTTGVEADFSLVVVTSALINNTCAAEAFVCHRVPTGRPGIGKLMFNTELLPLPKGNHLVHERNVNLAIHELVHTLGFNKPSYKFYIDEAGNPRADHFRAIQINGEERYILDLEPLTNRLRKHFGCNSIQGALLENDGGNGSIHSHFERRVFLYEVMTSGIIPGQRVSEFTLAALEGSGWYVADYSFAEPFFFGEGQGCDFYNGPKINADTEEYCAEERSMGCAPTGRGGGKCRKDFKSDGYKYYVPTLAHDCENAEAEDNASLQGFESFGKNAGSKCFTGTLGFEKSQQKTNSFCFKFQCQGEGLDTVLEVSIGNKKAICQAAGPMTVDGFSGELNCPDPLAYCKTVGQQYCPRNCMGRGDCINNQCRCEPGFSGKDCSVSVTKTFLGFDAKTSF